MSEIKKEVPDKEIFDQELKDLLGDHYVDATVEPVPEAVEPEKKADWCRLKASACLLGADALLMFMCLADKIELAYGLVFLAAASAFLGAKVNNGRL